MVKTHRVKQALQLVNNDYVYLVKHDPARI